MDFQVEIDASRPVAHGDETFVLERGGVRRTVRLHDYDDIYAVPGLYEHVVQDRLGCTSPQTLTAALADAVTSSGTHLPDVRCLDVGAGNGVLGQALRAAGMVPVVGLDASATAAAAAERDYPGLYAEYVTGELDPVATPALIARYELTALVSAGALTGGHIEPSVLATTWDTFASGHWLAFTCTEHHADDAKAGLEHDTVFITDDRFVHRRLTDGTPIWYRVVIGRKA